MLYSINAVKACICFYGLHSFIAKSREFFDELTLGFAVLPAQLVGAKNGVEFFAKMPGHLLKSKAVLRCGSMKGVLLAVAMATRAAKTMNAATVVTKICQVFGVDGRPWFWLFVAC